jgi:hypothetical protein
MSVCQVTTRQQATHSSKRNASEGVEGGKQASSEVAGKDEELVGVPGQSEAVLRV